MRQYGLLGKRLTHSFSKTYFTEKFLSQNISDCNYLNFEIPSIDALPELLQAHPLLRGLNVTIPYKKEVIPYLDTANKIVQETGACNCIRIEDKKLSGFNTDVIGFQKSLQSVIKLHHTKALVLGTGGSSVAVQYALRKLGISFLLVSRTGNGKAIRYSDLDAKVMQHYPLIINTTPLGMFPDLETAPDIPYRLLTPQHLLFDLVYNPEQTQFLKRGLERGSDTCNGYPMLVLQAEESWAIWNR